MSLLNKLLLPGLVLSFVSVASGISYAADKNNTNAKEEETSDEGAVIFRIENIAPVMNKDGIAEKCKFTFTVYNRMEHEIAEANLKLSWKDNIEAKYKIDGGNVKPNDAKAAEQILEKEIVLQTLPPHIQRSFEDSIDTNKCFLLLDQLDFTVSKCLLTGEKDVSSKETNKNDRSKKEVASSGSCADRFNYINSQNPEYYSEFKDMPDSMIEKQADAEKAAELSKIQEVHDSIKSDMENIKATLSKIQ